MKLGRFIVDTHVHAQRFAAGSQLSKMSPKAEGGRYTDLAQAIRRIEAYDNAMGRPEVEQPSLDPEKMGSDHFFQV